MPVSNPVQIPNLCKFLSETRPLINSVLDVGVGLGINGVMVRAHLDGTTKWKFVKEEWLTRLVGVEIFNKYENPIWNIYDKITIGNIKDLLFNCEIDSVDCVLFTDVIEHLSKEDGLFVLRELKKISRMVYVTTPAEYWPQQSVHGNECEKHVCLWTQKEFEELGFEIDIIANQIIAVWKNEQH